MSTKHEEVINELSRGMTEYGAARLFKGLEVSSNSRHGDYRLQIIDGTWHLLFDYAAFALPQEAIDSIVGTAVREAMGERENADAVLAEAEALGRKIFRHAHSDAPPGGTSSSSE